MKNTLKKNFFILINFYAKIEYVADLDYSANANSGMRQVLYTFNGSHVPSEESQKGCLSKKFPGGPQGGAQSTILINFYAKIEYVADLDYSANANSGMRQVLYTFPGSHVPFEESQKGC